MVSLGYILFVIFIAIFAYPLSPDDSTDANEMHVEIATRKPGFSCLFYHKSNHNVKSQNGWIHYILHGREELGDAIPIQDYSIKSDSIFLQAILDETANETISFSLNGMNQDNFIAQRITQRIFYLGTDRFGRDMLSRLLIGTRVSIAVGCIAVIISIFIGVLLGSLAAYYGKWVDQLITWLINVVWAIPTLLLVFAITFALGKGFWQIFVAVGLTMWVGTARLIRGQVLSIKELEFIQAAKSMGFSSMRILGKHILPNVLGPTMVLAASNFATAILIEAGLSFLGIGVQPPVSSWGLMIKENYNFIITNHPMLAIIPGLAIMLIVLAFNLAGNGLRDALDVRGKV